MKNDIFLRDQSRAIIVHMLGTGQEQQTSNPGHAFGMVSQHLCHDVL
jgi:hypothetical protein